QNTNGIYSQLSPLVRKIGYNFHNKALLVQALKHRSYLSVSNEGRLHSNERLELLGDAVLGLVVTKHLYQKYPDREEGGLTTMKSIIVSREILTRVANELKLGNFVLLSEAEDRAGGRKRPSIIADAFEAIVGAIYLDGGLPRAERFIKRHLLKKMGEILNEEQNKNFKSLLLEYAQSKNSGPPIYTVKREEGPDHNKLFTVEVKIQDQILGIGKGNSKKKAEQRAAQNALKKLLII
ncbi:MAG: ribonuclease III, partial [candidate division KSB1 bacterium]|nr:ribonuclease III [candidate division KSB1 bacterium]